VNPKWAEALKRFDAMRAKPLDEKIEHSLSLIKKVFQDHQKCCVACSFGKDSTVLLHLVRQINPNVLVIFSNTGVEFKETLEFKEYLVKEWNLNFVELKPEKTFWQCVKEYGYPHLRYWSLSRQRAYAKGKIKTKDGTPKCCYYLKEKPAYDFYKKNGIEAVFVGITWDESYQRRWTAIRYGDYFYSKKKKIWRAMPILYWDTNDIWRYIEENNLPVNPAYKKYGVDRIGCITCTGHLGWKEQMARLYPGLYKKIMKDLNGSNLDDFLEKEVIVVTDRRRSSC
jgi:phosphoadenosine phosphosulfate reductase